MDHMARSIRRFYHIESTASRTWSRLFVRRIFEGPFTAVCGGRRVLRTLPLRPPLPQRVRFVPAALGRPVSVDDPHFRLDYHIRHTALPPPGSAMTCGTSLDDSCPSRSTGSVHCGRCRWSKA